MKVKCIWSGPWASDGVVPHGEFPREGAIYTVVEVWEDFYGEWFVLAECDKDDLFCPSRFRPLDEIDELAELICNVKAPKALEPTR